MRGCNHKNPFFADQSQVYSWIVCKCEGSRNCSILRADRNEEVNCYLMFGGIHTQKPSNNKTLPIYPSRSSWIGIHSYKELCFRYVLQRNERNESLYAFGVSSRVCYFKRGFRSFQRRFIRNRVSGSFPVGFRVHSVCISNFPVHVSH